MTTTTIPHPLRLARGSHQPGSGKGCAMNVISYTNGGTEITDYPACSARPLARLVQRLNDRLAGDDGYLSPENSMIALDLGWLTVATADVSPEVAWHWLADLLTDERVARDARSEVIKAIRGVSELCRRQADGSPVSVAEWRTVWPHGRPEISNCRAFGDSRGESGGHHAETPPRRDGFSRSAFRRLRT
jgi:hypothetical protein